MIESLFSENQNAFVSARNRMDARDFSDRQYHLDPSFFQIPQPEGREKQMSNLNRAEDTPPAFSRESQGAASPARELICEAADDDFILGRKDMQEIFENYNDSNFQIHYFMGSRSNQRALRESLRIPEDEEILVEYKQKRFLRETATVVMTSKGVYIDYKSSPVKNFQYKDIISADSDNAVVKLKGYEQVAIPRPVVPPSTWESFFIFLQMCGDANHEE